MPNWVWGVAFLVAYVVLTQWLRQNLVFLLEEAKVAPSLGAKLFRGQTLRRTMTTIAQIEFRESLLSIRDEILQSLGHPVISALGSPAARNLDLSHSAWQEESTVDRSIVNKEEWLFQTRV
jgi:hypothetical protein